MKCDTDNDLRPVFFSILYTNTYYKLRVDPTPHRITPAIIDDVSRRRHRVRYLVYRVYIYIYIIVYYYSYYSPVAPTPFFLYHPIFFLTS